MSVAAPASEAELADAVATAAAAGRRLTIVGGGTRSGLGRPPAEGAQKLDLQALAGVTLYEPGELVLSARAGTPLSAIEAMLRENNQMLPFEPMEHKAVYGTAGESSIGALAACNISGPRRLSAGAARDHLIGIRLVNGRGEIVKSGGRVMKNVTGLDLVKLNCGAHGTLGVLSEVTFKLLPRPEHRASLALIGLDATAALTAMNAAMRLPFDVAAAAHLPAGLETTRSTTLLRFEGFPESVAYRMREVARALDATATGEPSDGVEDERRWAAIRDATMLAEPKNAALLRIHVPASRAGSIARRADAEGLRYVLDWGGGLIWLALSETQSIDPWRAMARTEGGHATLVRASPERRSSEAVFEPPDEAVLRLTAGIKAAFDPNGVLNFGRMYRGV